MFFMDVNFDGEEDFIVAHKGYNRTYYACFDLVNGNSSGSCPGLLESNNEPPYNNIVSGINVQPSYTVFNRQKKDIYMRLWAVAHIMKRGLSTLRETSSVMKPK